jgi:hypothetical protein
MESPAFSLQFALRECATSILLLGNVRTRLVEPLDTGYVISKHESMVEPSVLNAAQIAALL